MTTNHERYSTAAGVEGAIKAAATAATKLDPSLDVSKRIQLEYFNRFLSRVFSEGDRSPWVLKGGTGILARIGSSRSTTDIDLFQQRSTIAYALDDLVRLARVDLGDYFRFELVNSRPSIGTDTQPYTEGFTAHFNVFIGVNKKSPLNVDVAIGTEITDDVAIAPSASALRIPKLVSNPYRLYPVVDQIADKVCATMTEYRARRSSREKDLVDLVVFANTQDIDGASLRRAIVIEMRRRKMDLFERFEVPNGWGRGYASLSRPVPHCSDFRTIDLASELVCELINPALDGTAVGKTWRHALRKWV